jgi:hypothetical protein
MHIFIRFDTFPLDDKYSKGFYMRLNELFNSLSQISESQGELFDKKVYYVMINGKIWKRDGEPVEFTSFKSADQAALSIIQNHGKAAQVIDPTKYPVR